jgi:hypothetical protein
MTWNADIRVNTDRIHYTQSASGGNHLSAKQLAHLRHYWYRRGVIRFVMLDMLNDRWRELVLCLISISVIVRNSEGYSHHSEESTGNEL